MVGSRLSLLYIPREWFIPSRRCGSKTGPVVISSQLCWFQVPIEDPCQKSEKQYFYKRRRIDNGITDIPKLRVEKGWVLRCNFLPRAGQGSFIHILLVKENRGWRMFLKMLKSFKWKHDYMTWYSEQGKPKTNHKEKGKENQGWRMFLEMLKSFKRKHDYMTRYSDQGKPKMSQS